MAGLGRRSGRVYMECPQCYWHVYTTSCNIEHISTVTCMLVECLIRDQRSCLCTLVLNLFTYWYWLEQSTLWVSSWRNEAVLYCSLQRFLVIAEERCFANKFRQTDVICCLWHVPIWEQQKLCFMAPLTISSIYDNIVCGICLRECCF